MLTAFVLAQAMGGAHPTTDIGRATAACSHRLAQLATRYHLVDLAAQPIQPIQQVDGGFLVRLTVIIRYNRKDGIELRKGVIGCLVSEDGRVEILEALPQ